MRAKLHRALFSRFALGLLLAAAGLGVLGGCGLRELARGELKPPQVTLKAIALGVPIPGTGWPLSATLLLENPNPQTISLAGYDYELTLEGRSVAQGASREGVTLPSLGHTTVEVPILLKVKAVVGLLPAILQEKKMHYQLSGGVRLAAPLLGGLRVPFRFQGHLTPQEGLDHLRSVLR